MANTIQASVLHGAKDLRVEEQEIEAPGPDDVQIAIKATGLCGTDVHYYQDYRIGDVQVQEPLTLGHEAAGIVTAVGSNVSGLRVGEVVAVEPGVPCGECRRCREGRYNLCSEVNFLGSARSSPHSQGTLRQRINHPAAWCHRLPRGVHVIMGALLEPLSVAIHAFRRAGLNSKSRPKTLILGAGTIGLCCAAICKFNEANMVAVADARQERVDFARENGFATDAFTIDRGEGEEGSINSAKEIAQQARDLQSRASEGFDVVFECTGAEVCSQVAVYAARSGGKVILVGMGKAIQTLPVSEATQREVDILGTFRYANTYTTAIELLSKPRATFPGLHQLITHSFDGLDKLEGAFQVASRAKDDSDRTVLKVLITFNDSE